MGWFAFARWLTDKRRLRLISSRDNCQRFSQPQISDPLRAEFEPVQNLSSHAFLYKQHFYKQTEMGKKLNKR